LFHTPILFAYVEAREGSLTRWDIEADGSDIDNGDTLRSSPQNSHAGSPELDKAGENDDNSSDISKSPSPTPSAKATKPGPASTTKKCKFKDGVADIAADERRTRAKIALSALKEKTTRATEREQIKCKSIVAVEHARIAHDRNEGALRRAHEILMFDKQLELERIHSGTAGRVPLAPPLNVDPSL
jgi:hypothetical protein